VEIFAAGVYADAPALQEYSIGPIRFEWGSGAKNARLPRDSGRQINRLRGQLPSPDSGL